MSLVTVLPMPTPSPSTPLRHPEHRSPRQKTPSPTFIDRWRQRMRSDLASKIKTARENSTLEARGGPDEVKNLTHRYME